MSDIIPALRFRWLTQFYDPLIAATLREEKFKKRLAEQAQIKPGHRVLDLGCGTATLMIILNRSNSGLYIYTDQRNNPYGRRGNHRNTGDSCRHTDHHKGASCP